MRKFLERAIKTIPRMNKAQLEILIKTINEELILKDMVMGSLKQGILVSDHEDKVVYSNKAIDLLLPVHHGEHTEHLVWTIIDDFELYSFIKESLYEHKTINDKIFILDDGKNSSTRILSISILPLASKGIIYGNVIFVDDVTEIKEREIKLKRAESLASLTTMAAGVAHEIKNPLGSMSIHIQLMNKLIERESFDKDNFSKYLNILSEEVDRLNGIVVDYLFTVRPMNVELEEGNINDVILDLIEFIQFELKEANIDIELKLCQDLPLIFQDKKFLKQAFLNIIKNAIQSMPNGGIIIISSERVDNMVQITITDTGIGMDQEIQEKIFEPHFTTKETGSGLGLTTVYKIIKEHKGDIKVTSKKGSGTCFKFLFPGILSKEMLLLN